jgi:hypothetical protein
MDDSARIGSVGRGLQTPTSGVYMGTRVPIKNIYELKEQKKNSQ